MGTGTDVAIESAGVTLIKGDLSGNRPGTAVEPCDDEEHPPEPVFAFIYNAAGVPVAAGILYPTFGLLLSPIIAAAGNGAFLGQRNRQIRETEGVRI